MGLEKSFWGLYPASYKITSFPFKKSPIWAFRPKLLNRTLEIHIHAFIAFVDPENIGVEPKYMFLSHSVQNLLPVQYSKITPYTHIRAFKNMQFLMNR